MEDPIDAWEGEGGSAAGMAASRMIGTPNQIIRAALIKSKVDVEFDRVRRILEYAAAKQSPENVTDIQAIVRILEEKRAEVMENERAEYFIHDWQDLRDQVSQMVIRDPRYEAIKAGQMARFGPGRGRGPNSTKA